MTDQVTLWLLIAMAGIAGLAIGSHLNVVIARIPDGRSVVGPGSECMSCATPIRARDNIPLLSWVLLRGRCRNCSSRIPARYPAVEAVTAVAFAAATGQILAAEVNSDIDTIVAAIVRLLAVLLFLSIAIALICIDIAVYRLPDVLVLPGIGIGIALIAQTSALEGSFITLGHALIGGAALLTFYAAIHLITRGRGMGLGDVKLAALCGLYLGWYGWGTLAVGAFIPFLLGAIASAIVIRRGGTRKSAIPFGPYMLTGTVIALAFGQPLASFYLTLIGLG